MMNLLINLLHRTVPTQGGWLCVRCGAKGQPGTRNERLRHRCRSADVVRFQALLASDDGTIDEWINRS
jgi:hypothetical protein